MMRNPNVGILVLVATTVAALGGRGAAADVPASASEARAQDTQEGGKPRRLDLRVPAITKLYSPEQIERLLAATRDIEEVEVEGAREPPPPPTPAVWGGIAAPVWAIVNPTQSWRILAPVTPDRAKEDEQPDATHPYREPILPTR